MSRWSNPNHKGKKTDKRRRQRFETSVEEIVLSKDELLEFKHTKNHKSCRDCLIDLIKTDKRFDHLRKRNVNFRSGWIIDSEKKIDNQTKDFDGIYAAMAYTAELEDIPSNLQLYSITNKILRKRDKKILPLIVDFVVFLKYFLEKGPFVKTILWRGFNPIPKNISSYTIGDLVYWGGFSSTSSLDEVAREFCGDSGVLLKISCPSAKDISKFSFFNEDEFLLPPNTRLVVAVENRKVNGTNQIDLVVRSDKDIFTW